ncbi:hypothetical protein HYW55_01570 [Candidatus Gottesmanbacteria bacterium]|nr:hypothetical protein [Candidatus Gottesmanbacteria bacterium]
MKRRNRRTIVRWILRFLPVFLLTGCVTLVVLFLFQTSRWDGKSRFTLVLNSRPLLVLSIEPETKRSVLVAFPANTQLSLPYGYGTYVASSVYPLGNLDKKRGGGMLLSRSIEETLGVPVYGFFSLEEQVEISLTTVSDTAKLKRDYFSYIGVIPRLPSFIQSLSGSQTNISIIDLFRLWQAIRSFRSDTVIFIDAQKEGLLWEEKLPDGINVFTIDTDSFGNRYPDIFQDHEVRLEEKSVEVVNATEVESVAKRFGWVLETMGADVLVKSTSMIPDTTSCVIHVRVKEIWDSAIVQRLMRYYGCKKGEISLSTNVVDLQVVLGVGFTQ